MMGFERCFCVAIASKCVLGEMSGLQSNLYGRAFQFPPTICIEINHHGTSNHSFCFPRPLIGEHPASNLATKLQLAAVRN